MSAGATPWLDNVDRMMGETSDEKVADERVWEWLSPWLSTDDAERIRAVVYRFHATVADSMRSGRVFPAGDAAHHLHEGAASTVSDEFPRDLSARKLIAPGPHPHAMSLRATCPHGNSSHSGFGVAEVPRLSA